MCEQGEAFQLNRYDLINLLSEGAFARVYLVLDKQDRDR